jgi:phospholipid/cholesterol/gamma-HCH transport system substrate-binding protein
VNARQLETRVGGAACGLVGLLCLGVFVLGGPDTPPPMPLQVDFPSASGLKVGSKVCIAGVPAGEVVALSAHDGVYDASVSRRVFVRADLAIEADTAELIGNGASFTITTEGVLGERYVEVTPGSIDAPRLTAGVILPGVRSFQKKELSENAGIVGRIVGKLVRKHSGNLSGLGQDVRFILDRSGQALDRAGALVEAQTPKAVSLKARLGETQASVTQFSDSLAQTVASVKGAEPLDELRRAGDLIEAGAADANHHVEAALASFDELQVSGAALGDLVIEGAEGWERAGASVPRDIRALRRLINSVETSLGALMRDREFLDDVLGMTKDVKRHPWKMLMRWEH